MAAAALAVAACESSTEETRPLTVQVTVNNASPRAGEAVTFRVEATGTRLAGISIEYGDGATDSQDTFGARTAGANFTHAYAQPGTFAVTAAATENAGERATRQLSITVAAAATIAALAASR